MKKKLLTLFSIFLYCYYGNAQCTLTATCTGGNWSSPSTWIASGCGAITTPTDNCAIVIPACAIVNVDINSPEYDNMEIYVYGTLSFENGQKLNMCPGYVEVFAGGQLTGGNPGSKIDICGSTVWNGGTTTYGPVSYGGIPLPIELLSFKAEAGQKLVNISWSTASEINNDFFTVQRSQDGVTFFPIGEIDGAGNSTTVLNYSFPDNNPYFGLAYYRLKQTDFDGNYSYSAIEAIDFSDEEFAFTIFPNPNNGSTINIAFSSDLNRELSVSIYDAKGKKSYSNIIFIQDNSGGSIYVITPANGLASGIYTMQAISKQLIYNKKLIVR